MKKILRLLTATIILISCSGNTDRDLNSDTTTLTIDTGGLNAPDDTARHVNVDTGAYPADYTTGAAKTDLRSSKRTVPGGH
jgi:hypothetical protein